MGAGHPVTSPWEYACPDYVGLSMGVRIFFDNTTRAITSCVLYRDDGCQFHTFVIGADGSAKVYRLDGPADGTGEVKTYTAAQMARVGLSTIEDVLALQINVEP